MKGGATDFLTKPFRGRDSLAAVQAAIAKDSTLRQSEAEKASIHSRLDRLTTREREVLQHVISGAPNKIIADQLGISERTVKVHRARVMQKMEVLSVAELTRLADRAAVEPPGPDGAPSAPWIGTLGNYLVSNCVTFDLARRSRSCFVPLNLRFIIGLVSAPKTDCGSLALAVSVNGDLLWFGMHETDAHSRAKAWARHTKRLDIIRFRVLCMC